MKNLVSIIEEFMLSKHDYVFLLKGDWGIGKTYFWNKNEETFKSTNEGYSYYSKISLYGKKSSTEIYREILFNAEEINGGRKAKTIYEKTLNILSKSPYIQGFIGNILIEHSISKVNNSIIVLDDFERINSDDFDEVFGLVNDLKSKNNKVILISNIQSKYNELINHIEKNIDVEYQYDPEIHIIIENIFSEKKYSDYLKTIIEIANDIGLRNMRAIKKLHRNIKFLLNRTSQITVKVLLSDLTLYTLCRFSQNTKLPAYDQLVNSDPYMLFLRDNATDEEKEASRLTQKYIKNYNDEVKNSLLKLIEYGFVEEHKIETIKNHIENNFENRERYELYNKAWNYYHNNYNNDEDAFIELMYTGCKENLDQIDPRNFESSINILRELGEKDKASELLEEYFKVNQNRFKNLLSKHAHSLPMSFEVKTEEMRKRINLLKEENKEIRTIEEILKKVTYASGWGSSDVNELAYHPIDEYEKFIRETEADNLDDYIRCLIKFGEYQSSSEKQNSIKNKTIEALKRIKADGGLNKIRVENKFNIE
ncbi:MAG: P-loop NTPase fold protein [Candidatus Paceibacterota bacterium]